MNQRLQRNPKRVRQKAVCSLHDTKELEKHLMYLLMTRTHQISQQGTYKK